MFSDIGLGNLLNCSELLFIFLFSFHKMASNGIVSHEFVIISRFLLAYSAKAPGDSDLTEQCFPQGGWLVREFLTIGYCSRSIGYCLPYCFS